MTDSTCPNAGNRQRAIPQIIVKGADKAIEHYKKAFGAVEQYRMMCPVTHTVAHASIKLGETEFFMAEEHPERGCTGATNQSFFMYVPDVDAMMKQSVSAGLKQEKPAEDQFWGDRMGIVKDPYGIQWMIATHVRDVSQQEMEEAMKKMGKEKAA
ncbi:MAG: VOC family protein [Alphaproteobacteria bacterium]